MNWRLLFVLILLNSCSKSGDGGSSAPSSTKENLEAPFYGIYQALLAPINKTVSGHLNGSLTIVREHDEFVADVRLSNGPKSVLHAQNIHVGDRCPDESDDLNGDGFIDGEEGAYVFREIIIPLDDDLSSQRMGLGTYPVTDEYGYYFWSRHVPFEKLLSDLREEDINHTDDYVKLENQKNLHLKNFVIVINGIPESTPLPQTVRGRGRATPHQALPIACGVIRKLEHVPGIIDKDETSISVPAGETIGGSSGADDGADFPSDQGTTTGNYGEEGSEIEALGSITSIGTFK